MGDVGDGDGDDVAAIVFRVGIRFGENGVVVILGVGRVDGDQRQLAPILAAAKRRFLRCLGFLKNGLGEDMRYAVRVDGDHGDRALAFHRADAFAYLGARHAIAAGAQHVDGDQITVLRVAEITFLGTMYSFCFRSTGAIRALPSGRLTKTPSTVEGCRSKTLMVRPR